MHQHMQRIPSLIVFVIVSALYLSGGLDSTENKLTEWRFLLTERDASGDLVVVDIDSESLNDIEIWPWPRGLYAVALERLFAAGVERVAFDIDFSSPSLPEEDQMLQNALARSKGKVILPIFKQQTTDAEGGRDFTLSLPISQFRDHTQLAFINVQPEMDGLIRRVKVHENWDKQEFPSLPYSMVEETGFGFDSFFIDYGIRKNSIPRVSFVDVVRGTFDTSVVKGKKVIVGATAVELGNQLAVPVHLATSGTMIQAIAYESLLQGRTLLPIAPAPILAITFLLALFFGPRFNDWSWRRGIVMVLFTTLPLMPLSIGLQFYTPVLLDITPWMLLIIFSYAVSLVRRIDQQGLLLMFQGLEIRRRDTMMRNIVENSFEGIMTIDNKGFIESMNPAAIEMFGYSPEKIQGHHLGRLFPDLNEECEEDELFEFLRIGKGSHEIAGRRVDKNYFPVEAEISEIRIDNRTVFTAFIRDITEQSNLKRELEHQALHDSLTSLPNRTLFFDRLDHAISAARRSGKSLAILLIDLDRFKGINDTMGHHVGDILLKKVSKRLQYHLRDSDTVARLGGDEFVILVPEILDTDNACQLAVKILGTLERQFQLDEYKIEISASIGIAIFPEHGDEAKLLVRNADSAMYKAKKEHIDFSVYAVDQNENRPHQFMLVNDLRSAIKEELLVLHYQPKMDLAREEISGVEALVRWPHPKHGMMLPDEFICLAEQTGLIRQLTFLVIDKAIEQCAKWHKDGFELEVSVNLSAHCLQDLTLSKTIDKMIHKWNLPANYLSLEITESAVMVDPVRAKKAIKLLKGIGLQISIDDFGTGYSSLSYLNNLAANELKIDKSFVLNMKEDNSNVIIVESTIGLAHNLGMRIVAEGIEDAEINEMLKSLGCDLGQGYLFCPPLTSEALNKWLAETVTTLKPGSLEYSETVNKLTI